MIRSTSATFVGTLALLARPALAQDATDYFDPGGVIGGSGLPTDSPVAVTLNIISAFLGVIGLIALIIIIYAGFTIMTSAGNTEKVEKGKQMLTWAVIGIIIILSSLGIIQFIDYSLRGE